MAEEFRTSEFEEEYDAFLEGETQEVKGRLLSERIRVLKPATAVSLDADTPVEKAIETLRERRIGAVLVTRGQDLVGIFTERDALLKCTSDVDQGSTKLSDVMTPDPETLAIGDGIAYALNMMHLGGYRHIPIRDQDGWRIVSVRDISRWIVELFPDAVLNLPPEPGMRDPDAESGG